METHRVSVLELYSDSIEDWEALFSQFRSIYPHEYLLKRNECDGYFLLGSSDNEIMQSISKMSSLQTNKEILIIVNNNVSGDSNIFDGSMYEDANVNIVSLSGIWKLSENYLKPRVFTKLERYEEMVHDYNKIDFQGKEIQVCSIYRPPMTYFNRTINKTIDGSEVEVFIMDHELERDGIEMQLFLIMAEKLNFTWTIRKPKGNYRYGRRINETVWQGGMIEMLRNKQVDMAFGSIWLTYDQHAFINLSEAWYQVYLHFLVPRPRRTTSFWALTRPFSENVWYLLVSAIFLHSIYTWARAWLDPKFPKRFRNFLITLTDLIGCLLSSSVPKTMANNKLQILLWQTAGWLIITAYCSSLAAWLAGSEYESRIDSIEQFLASNLRWGEMGQPPPFRDYFDLTIIMWLKETGITVWHLRNVIRRRDNYNLREVRLEHDGYDGSVQVLGLTPLGAGFSLLLVGLSIATFVFYLELKHAAKSTSVREILRDIDNKRKCKRRK
ncbi:uncharacterized protein LOC117600898 isoform X2 [Osmia lignaria lignaria]|uniref:uncharacterized protein LOC117600898 isoform X2 n=1 Tax=Osmia lignaria lignaria TaxID=1437193 RepID=UPI00402BA2AD